MWYNANRKESDCMKVYNNKKIIVALLLAIAGVIIVFACPEKYSGFGYSFLTSAIVTGLNVWLVDVKEINPLDGWGIEKIYKTRAEKNQDSDPKLVDAQHRIDCIAFGLKNFRSMHTDKIEDCLNRGVNIRLLTMDPDCKFAEQRDIEERDEKGHLRNSINQLVEWADRLNEKSSRGTITVKGYSCMTLDFYWRVDDELYVGPYWYGMPSQQTITYKFQSSGQGAILYIDYFDKLWNDKQLTRVLTK